MYGDTPGTPVGDLNALIGLPGPPPLPSLPEAERPRESLVNTAVKFLGNPRVQSTSAQQQETFLRQKGLTEDEIQEAFRRAKIPQSTEQGQPLILPPTSAQQPSFIYPIHPHQLSLWYKLKEIGNVVALLSFGSYGLYTLWKSTIAPWFYSKPSVAEERNRLLLAAISSLTASVCELRGLISKLESHLHPQLQPDTNGNRSRELLALEEVREELSAIKALLLSRTQFPSSPGIPSWQLVEKESTSREDSRDQSPNPNEDRANGNQKAERGTVEFNRGRKQSSTGSHESIALHSDGSSCEVVIVEKQDADHSDDA